MGSARRHVPKYLASKLKAIREYLELTQEQMVERLTNELKEEQVNVQQTQISAFERGTREPPLIVVMAYARIVNIPMETLVNDKVSLPFDFELFLRRESKKPIKIIEPPPTTLNDVIAVWRRYKQTRDRNKKN